MKLRQGLLFTYIDLNIDPRFLEFELCCEGLTALHGSELLLFREARGSNSLCSVLRCLLLGLALFSKESFCFFTEDWRPLI